MSRLISLFLSYRSINRNDLQTYIKEHYKGPRIVLAAAGGRTKSLLFAPCPAVLPQTPKNYSLRIKIFDDFSCQVAPE